MRVDPRCGSRRRLETAETKLTEMIRRRAVPVLVRGEDDQDLDVDVGGREAVIDEDLVEQQPAVVNDVRLLRLEGSPAATQYGAKGTTCPGEAEGLRPKFWHDLTQVPMGRLWCLPGCGETEGG